jgi:hypothetical protein
MSKRSLSTKVPATRPVIPVDETRLNYAIRKVSLSPKPNRVFSIGEKVRVRHSMSDEIVSILHTNEDGVPSVYGISFYSSKGTWEGSVVHPFPWFEVFSTYLGMGEDVVSFNPYLRVHKNTRRLDSLFYSFYGHSMDKERLNLSPIYQRDYVWTSDDKERLIHSIFLGKNIGTFSVYVYPFNEIGDGTFDSELLDGKQRLTTMVSYTHDEFPYRGTYFSGLDFKSQNHFYTTTVQVLELQGPLSMKERMEYFLYINDTGVPQSPEHLRKIREKLLDV